MPCYQLEGITPVIHPDAYVDPTAVLIGDVIVGPDCYVGPCASLRGDFGRLILERGANLPPSPGDIWISPFASSLRPMM